MAHLLGTKESTSRVTTTPLWVTNGVTAVVVAERHVARLAAVTNGYSPAP